MAPLASSRPLRSWSPSMTAMFDSAACSVGSDRTPLRAASPSLATSKIGSEMTRLISFQLSPKVDIWPSKVDDSAAIPPPNFSLASFRAASSATGRGDVNSPDFENSIPTPASCSRVTIPSSCNRLIASPVAPDANFPHVLPSSTISTPVPAAMSPIDVRKADMSTPNFCCTADPVRPKPTSSFSSPMSWGSSNGVDAANADSSAIRSLAASVDPMSVPSCVSNVSN